MLSGKITEKRRRDASVLEEKDKQVKNATYWKR